RCPASVDVKQDLKRLLRDRRTASSSMSNFSGKATRAIQILRGRLRPVLRCLEPFHRSGAAHHIDRYARLCAYLTLTKAGYKGLRKPDSVAVEPTFFHVTGRGGAVEDSFVN